MFTTLSGSTLASELESSIFDRIVLSFLLHRNFLIMALGFLNVLVLTMVKYIIYSPLLDLVGVDM